MVDVEPHAAEVVDELREAAEVDGDEVVDRQSRERAHGLDAAGCAALRERRVDPVAKIGAARAFDRRDQVTRERQHRERPRVGIGPDEDQGVGAAGELGLLALSAVGADYERDRRLTGNRHVETFCRCTVGPRLRADRREELMRLQIRGSGNAARDDHGRDQDPERHQAHDLPRATPRRVRLPVAAHRRVRPRRVDRATVAVNGRAAPDASLERRFHSATKAGRRPISSGASRLRG